MRASVKEAISICYTLRAMGVKVEKSSFILGDNLGMVQNTTMKESLLKKNHVALSFHMSQEATAAEIVYPLKTKVKWNYSDALTNAMPLKLFSELIGTMFHG